MNKVSHGVQAKDPQILGVIPIGTSLDSESERSRELNCWNGPDIIVPFVEQWTSSQLTPEFEPDTGYCDALINVGFNECSEEVREFWRTTIKSNYRGDNGRRRIRMAAINLAERGGLYQRLSDIHCPVMWLHVRFCSGLCPGLYSPVQGTKDAVYSVANATEGMKRFTHSSDAQLVTVEGGAHFLNCSNAREEDEAVLNFVTKYGRRTRHL